MNNIIKEAIGRPVAVVAIIFLAILFGYVALQNIPIQMSPDIEKPIYQVRVSWPGAAPTGSSVRMASSARAPPTPHGAAPPPPQ